MESPNIEEQNMPKTIVIGMDKKPKSKKKIIIIIAAALIVLTIAVFIGSRYIKQPTALTNNAVVLNINGKNVKYAEFNAYMKYQEYLESKANMGQPVPDGMKARLLEKRKQLTIEMIEKIIICAQRAKDKGLSVSDKEYPTLLKGIVVPQSEDKSINEKIKEEFALKEKLLNKYIEETTVEDVEVKAFYDKNKQYYAKPYDQEKEEIKKMLKYNNGSLKFSNELAKWVKDAQVNKNQDILKLIAQ